jgi:hypothetical protein
MVSKPSTAANSSLRTSRILRTAKRAAIAITHSMPLLQLRGNPSDRAFNTKGFATVNAMDVYCQSASRHASSSLIEGKYPLADTET